MATTQEIASLVAGGIPFLIQPPIPGTPDMNDDPDQRHLLGLFRFDTVVPPVSGARVAAMAIYYRAAARQLFIRAWTEDGFGIVKEPTLLLTSEIELFDDTGEMLGHVTAAADPVGTEFVTFTMPVALALSHSYRLRVWLRDSGGRAYLREHGFSVTR